MPKYTYLCKCGLNWDEYAGYDDVEQPCRRCGEFGQRVQVYVDQYISAETGPRGGRKNEPPREEKSYRKQFKEFQEASQEVEHAYSRIDDPKVTAPSYYKEGLKRAKKLNPKVRA